MAESPSSATAAAAKTAASEKKAAKVVEGEEINFNKKNGWHCRCSCGFLIAGQPDAKTAMTALAQHKLSPDHTLNDEEQAAATAKEKLAVTTAQHAELDAEFNALDSQKKALDEKMTAHKTAVSTAEKEMSAAEKEAKTVEKK